MGHAGFSVKFREVGLTTGFGGFKPTHSLVPTRLEKSGRVTMSLIWNSIAWTQSQRESHMASIIKDSITKGVNHGINYQGLNHKGSHIWYQLSRTQSSGVKVGIN